MGFGFGLGFTLGRARTVDSGGGGGDITAPTLSTAVIPSGGATVVLSYDEALDTGSTPAAGAYSLAGTARTVSSVGVSGSAVTLTLSGVIGVGVAGITVSYTPGAAPVQDLAGNDAASLTTQAVTNNSTQDITAPVFSSAAIPSAGTSLILTYGEALDAGSTPANGDFALAGTARTVTGVNVTGSTVVLTLSAAVAQGATVTVSYTGGTNKIRDAAGNNSANLSGAAVTNNSTSDQTAPTLSTAIITTTGLALELTYNEALDTGSVPALVDFALAGTTLAALTGTPAVSGSKVTLTLSPAVASTETGITISYTAGASPVQDVAGNDAANLTSQAVTNNSTHAYDPRDEGGAVAWVDMLDATSFTQVANVLTALTEKISGTAMTITAAPTYSATGINAHPAFTLNGTTQYVSGTQAAAVAAGVNSTPRTTFIVAALVRVDTNVEGFLEWANSGVASNGCWGGQNATTSTGRTRLEFTNDAGTNVVLNGTIQVDTTAHIYRFSSPGTTGESAIDGTSDIASAAFDPVTSTPNRWAIGCRPDSIPDRFMSVAVGESWIFNKDLSSAARARVRTYLQGKWGTP